MQVKARNHGRSRIGMSYFGIRKRWDFIIDLDSLCMSFRPSNDMEASGIRAGCGCAYPIMAHSTTATSTYPLAKYSRSYPTQESQASEWQHFTNPVIRLVLDVKKATQLESVRLRILWSMDPTHVASNSDQTEMVFASPRANVILRIFSYIVLAGRCRFAIALSPSSKTANPGPVFESSVSRHGGGNSLPTLARHHCSGMRRSCSPISSLHAWFLGASTLSDNLLVVLRGTRVHRCHSCHMSLQT